MPTATVVKIPRKKLSRIVNDAAATAKAVNLVYVNNADEGIVRARAGKGFRYLLRGRLVKDKNILNRIRSLVIPPAWENVWICNLENGHLQATGIDVRKRKQYRYHPLWNELRNQTKFFRMHDFGLCLEQVRKRINADLSLPGLPKNKVLAAVASLMEKTSIRIGSDFYEKLYGSFGMTTLKDKHVQINGSSLKFMFKGKKGVEHDIGLKSTKLAKIVQQCRDIPGKELFQYRNEDGSRQTIDSGMVNEYIKDITGSDFTAKDFRTWKGSLTALTAFQEAGSFENEKEAKQKVVEVLNKVSGHLGNTRTVCKKYYVHPVLIEMYENGKLQHRINKIGQIGDEKVLLEILKAV